jgi:predicted TIM-barrel fold metal-dependent hydrolase
MLRCTTRLSRRSFLAATCVAAAGCQNSQRAAPTAPGMTRGVPGTIVDLHQHTNYSGRSDAELLAHQQNMGITYSMLLPAGHPVERPITHLGKSNGLAAQCGANETCYQIVCDHPDHFGFFANEVPDAETASAEIEKYLKLGAKGIGELKFNIDVESPEMMRIYSLAQEHRVPVLMHFQIGMYNHGFDRFDRVLTRFPKVNFIGHAQTMWANIDASVKPNVLYPKTKVTPGGLTDRYLSEHPNFHADISAGSGLGALLRDEDFARDFLRRHQDKIMYGSDCNDRTGKAPLCQGALTIIAIKRLAPSNEIREKILHGNAERLLALSPSFK